MIMLFQSLQVNVPTRNQRRGSRHIREAREQDKNTDQQHFASSPATSESDHMKFLAKCRERGLRDLIITSVRCESNPPYPYIGGVEFVFKLIVVPWKTIMVPALPESVLQSAGAKPNLMCDAGMKIFECTMPSTERGSEFKNNLRVQRPR
jgi:hypothetical protein